MSVSPAPNLEGYATLDDVANAFDKIENGFDDTTNPTADEVRRQIRVESDWVDRYTGIAFRPRQVENEHLTLSGSYYFRAGTPLSLRKRNILPLDPEEGDKLEVWTGDSDGGEFQTEEGYEQWLRDNEHKEGRDEDFWIERSTGMLYIYRRRIFFSQHKEIRITYRFGQEWPDPANKPSDSPLSDEEYERQNVPQAIREATAKRVAAHYYESQVYRTTVPGNENAPDPSNIAEKFREESEKLLMNYKEVRTVGSQ